MLLSWILLGDVIFLGPPFWGPLGGVFKQRKQDFHSPVGAFYCRSNSERTFHIHRPGVRGTFMCFLWACHAHVILQLPPCAHTSKRMSQACACHMYM